MTSISKKDSEFYIEKNIKYGLVNYWIPPIEHRIDSDKILGMDLDWTLIKPKSGKVFPINADDWQFMLDDNGFKKIKSLMDSGYKFVIFTNQALIAKGKCYDLDGFKRRWLQIYDGLCNVGIKCVYLMFAVYDDFYRKPCDGMWKFMCEKINEGFDINLEASYYIGDAAGRTGDHSLADLQFALNIGITKFYVPEVFFKNDVAKENNTVELIKKMNSNAKVFKPLHYIEKFNEIIENPLYPKDSSIAKVSRRIVLEGRNQETFDILKKPICDKTQMLILFVGSPSSGKSSLYTDTIVPYLKKTFKETHNEKTNTWIYLSQDTFSGTATKFTKEVTKQLASGNSVIIDNTNSTAKLRNKFTNIAKTMNDKIVKCVIYFPMEKDVVMYLNTIRTKLLNIGKLNNTPEDKTPVPAVAIHSYWKRFEVIDEKDETIDMYLEWQFIPKIDKFNLQFV